MVISDLGSDFNSKLVAELVKLMGIRHTFSIADRHANGSERTIREVLRLLRTIAYDSIIEDVFDDSLIIPSVQYTLNTHLSLETSYFPFELTLGTQRLLYTDLLKGVKVSFPLQKLLQRLVDNIAKICAVSTDYHRALDQERFASQDPAKQYKYCEGDYDMLDTGPKSTPKMSSKYTDPFRVFAQVKNDVPIRNFISNKIRNFITDTIQIYSVHELDAKSAFDTTCHDDRKYVMKRVISYAGNCARRTEMSFMCECEDKLLRKLRGHVTFCVKHFMISAGRNHICTILLWTQKMLPSL